MSNSMVMFAATIAGAPPTKEPTGWAAYYTPDNVMTVVAAIAAASIAAWVAMRGYRTQQHEGRRQERARLYAEALRAVEDYLEAPYRIIRRDGSAEARRQLTESLSEIKSRISFYAGWLSINAPTEVYDAYCAYDKAARMEAGLQMTAAWKARPTKRDKDVPLGQGLPRTEADAARAVVLQAMKEGLKH